MSRSRRGKTARADIESAPTGQYDARAAVLLHGASGTPPPTRSPEFSGHTWPPLRGLLPTAWGDVALARQRGPAAEQSREVGGGESLVAFRSFEPWHISLPQSASLTAPSQREPPRHNKKPPPRGRGEGLLIIVYCSRKRERNSTVRGFCGCSKISVGVPSSQMTPSAM